MDSSNMRSLTDQRGVVLIVAMIALLLVTLITFAAVRSSTVSSRIAVIQELKAATFEAAESGAIMLARSKQNLGPPEPGVVRTYTSAAVGAPLPQFLIRGSTTAGSDDDVSVVTTGRAEFRREAAAIGYSLRKGGAGFQTYFYDLSARATVQGSTNTQSTVTQGIFIEAPRIN